MRPRTGYVGVLTLNIVLTTPGTINMTKCMVLGITKVDKEKNRGIRKKTRAQSTVKEIKQYQKVATTRTEDGHK